MGANPCFAEKDGGFMDAEKNDDCEMGRCCDVCVCTLQLDPICCGKDYPKEYGNPCMAECAGFKEAEKNDLCTMGQCELNCNCNRMYDPYCCDDYEYSNSCVAKCNGFSDPDNDGKCDRGKCDYGNGNGNNDKYYGKGGEDKEDKDKGKDKDEDKDCDDDKPVCCEDKYGIEVTYDSMCDAEKNDNIEDVDKDCSDGECKEKDCGCDKKKK